jgi:DMSO/TMAO reductase YedYZ molybdopterin-dependent catalytic subunit
VPALMGGVVMPNARFYIRNHFQIPNLNAVRYRRLAVGGLVRRKLSLSLRDLMQMPSQTFFATLECAGNGRTKFDPPIPGEKWTFGAVSTAEWTGVSLKAVLDRPGIESSAREVLFRGADRGTVEGSSGTIRFERSLRLDEAGESEAILAYVMNGEPLPIHQGCRLLSNGKISLRMATRQRGRARTRHTNAATGAYHRTNPRLGKRVRRHHDSRCRLVRRGSD